jgi:hypothetical protein
MWGKNPEVRKKEGGRWGVISERHNNKHEVQTDSEKKSIMHVYRHINEFWKGYEPKTNET